MGAVFFWQENILSAMNVTNSFSLTVLPTYVLDLGLNFAHNTLDDLDIHFVRAQFYISMSFK